jgi:hypothetical protein
MNTNNTLSHPCWDKESSLTSPSDRKTTIENPWRPEQNVPELSNDETDSAMKELNINDFTKKFPRVDRTYADPPPPLQKIGLISFIPSKGAKPDENGIYGFAKLRGNYDTEIEANQRAEFIIRKVDSYHPIQHMYVGRPFPLTLDPKYTACTEEIDIRRTTAKTMSEDIKAKRDDDNQIIKEIKEKEEALLAESRKAEKGEQTEQDIYDNYITLNVKKAQLTWTYLEHIKKMEEIRPIIAKTKLEIEELDLLYPTYKDSFLQKYMDARKQAGINETDDKVKDNFILYMVDDKHIPEIDDLYQQLKMQKTENK